MLEAAQPLLALAVRVLAQFDYPDKHDEKIICDMNAAISKATGENR